MSQRNSPGAELFVSPSGDDTNAGTRAAPFASLERARDQIRRLKQEGNFASEPVTVWLRGGDYFRTNAFELDASDSGTEQGSITWRACEGETVRLLGGRILTGFKRVSDPAILGRLTPEARDRVAQIRLPALGISDFGEMKSRGFGRPTTPSHCELFWNGRPMILARWPNEGSWEKIAGFPEDSAQADEHGGKLGRLENGFYYEGDRPRGWQQASDIWVHGYWAWDWANSYERVASIDVERRLIKTGSPYGQYGFRKGQRFYFLNVLEELDQPGEYYIDHKSGMLYFWPPDADVVAANSHRANEASSTSKGIERGNSHAEVLLSLLADPLLKLAGVSHVAFRGLTLEATRGNGVEIEGGASDRIANCVIRDVGDYGVKIQGGSGNGVQGCDILDTGDGGVSLQGGDRRTLAPGGHFVEDCEFARQGRWSKCYVPAVMLSGAGLRVSHNLIHDHPHCAILFGGNDHLIEFNEIHHVALETGDVGAIYAGRDYTFRGNRIRYNFIHDTGGVGMGSMGVYMDDCVSGAEIYGNVFYKVQRAAFLGGGRDHQVVNNIFVDCSYAVELDGRGLDTAPVWRGMVDRTMRHRLQEMPLSLYRERYPAMKTLDNYYGPPEGPAIQGSSFKGVPPEGNVVARNVCAGKWLHVYWHATQQMLDLENNLTNALSSFIHAPSEPPKATDFALRPECPAWKLGFQKLPLEEIGPRAARREAAAVPPEPR